MEKRTFYKALIFILLMSNIGTIGFIYFGHKNHPPHPEGPKQLVIDRLEMNNDQQKAYNLIITKHQKAIRAAQTERTKLKNDLYALLTKKEIDSEKEDSLIKLLTENHKQVELIHFDHLNEIKSLCKGENQLKKFNKLSLEFSKFFAPPLMKKH